MESVEEICNHIALINNSKTILQGSIQNIKEKYTRNDYEIIVKKGDLKANDSFTIKNKKKNKYLISIHKEEKYKSILSNILQENEIVAFNKKYPTVEEIFINAVKNE